MRCAKNRFNKAVTFNHDSSDFQIRRTWVGPDHARIPKRQKLQPTVTMSQGLRQALVAATAMLQCSCCDDRCCSLHWQPIFEEDFDPDREDDFIY
jgi:hypothetical protein